MLKKSSLDDGLCIAGEFFVADDVVIFDKACLRNCFLNPSEAPGENLFGKARLRDNKGEKIGAGADDNRSSSGKSADERKVCVRVNYLFLFCEMPITMAGSAPLL